MPFAGRLVMGILTSVLPSISLNDPVKSIPVNVKTVFSLIVLVRFVSTGKSFTGLTVILTFAPERA